jgi:hypothetical protein
MTGVIAQAQKTNKGPEGNLHINRELWDLGVAQIQISDKVIYSLDVDKTSLNARSIALLLLAPMNVKREEIIYIKPEDLQRLLEAAAERSKTSRFLMYDNTFETKEDSEHLGRFLQTQLNIAQDLMFDYNGYLCRVAANGGGWQISGLWHPSFNA